MDPLFKPCRQCGKEIGQLAVLTPKGLFCDDRCIARYINQQPPHNVNICITVVTTDPNSTSTVEFVQEKGNG